MLFISFCLAAATEVYVCSGQNENYKCEKISDPEPRDAQDIKVYESESTESSQDFLHLEQILFPKEAN